MKKPYFPMFIDVSEKRIVVVGGGKIAQRRIETLLTFADDILVAAPEITEAIRELCEEKRIRWVETPYHSDLLYDADMVLAATDDAQCNERIVEDCHKRGILVNAAHKKELCDFYFPAIVNKENLVVGVTTSGLSHREARRAREQIENVLNEWEDKDRENTYEEND